MLAKFGRKPAAADRGSNKARERGAALFKRSRYEVETYDVSISAAGSSALPAPNLI
jgi:hypothetical protein